MNKGELSIVYLVLFGVLLLSLASASWFSDLWARIIGKVATDFSLLGSSGLGGSSSGTSGSSGISSPPPESPPEPPPGESGETDGDTSSISGGPSGSSGDGGSTPTTNQPEEEIVEAEANLKVINTCSDSDKRIDLYVYGTTQGNRNRYGYSFEDTCEGNILIERYCDEDVPRDYRKNCEEEGEDYICLDGSCVLSSDKGISCSDSDGGLDLFIVGTTSDGVKSSVDYCQDDFSLVEYYCSPNKQISFSVITCPPDYICRKGKCSVKNFDLSCEDTDGGIDYNNRGEITGINYDGSFSSKDRCTSYASSSSEKNILLEYYCDENSPNRFSFEIIDCSEQGEICLEGACVSSNEFLDFFRNLFGQ